MKIINPLFVYYFVWVVGGMLYLFGMTTNLGAPPFLGVLLILMNLLSMWLVYYLVCRSKAVGKIHISNLVFVKSMKFLRIICLVWFLGTIIDIYFSGGLPMLWSLAGSDKLYTEFGIPSLHGILNALYLQIITLTFYLYFIFKKKGLIWFVILLMIWPLLMLGRGILLCAIVQIFCVFFYFNRLTYKYVFMIFVSVVSVVVLFGIVGDMRQTFNPFLYLVKDKYYEFFIFLPTGFLWCYVYLTAGFSNLFANIDYLATNFSFGYSFSNLLPSIIKRIFELDTRNDAIDFVDYNLNTSTVYASFVSDFGLIGGFFLVALIQVCCCYAYSLLIKGKPWGVLAYAVCYQVLMFSIFYDMFFLLPTLFQFVICFFFYLYTKNTSSYTNPISNG